jgi:hypothetical protein
MDIPQSDAGSAAQTWGCAERSEIISLLSIYRHSFHLDKAILTGVTGQMVLVVRFHACRVSLQPDYMETSPRVPSNNSSSPL